MTETLSPVSQLVHFTEHMRQASLTGRLLGLNLPERDRVLAEHFAAFDAAIDAAKAAAAAGGQPVAVDGAPVSLTDGGDTWWVHPDGRMTREYERFDGFEAFLGQLADRPAVDWTRPADRRQVLETAYFGFWSPSATNWQPTRVMEVHGEAAQAFARLAGWSVPADFPLLVLLRRDHYESLLGDVLEPFGLEVTAREESIDAGIFAQTMIMAALSQGLTVAEHPFAPAQRAEAKAVVAAELARRIDGLAGAADPHAAEMRDNLRHILAFVERDKYLPDAVMAIAHPLGGEVVPYALFPRVVGEHSTQRVASPSAEFGHDAMMRLWDVAVSTLPATDRELVRFADFSWHEQVPSRIGKAMFEALYGVGADPETKSGGEGGILTNVTVKNFLLHTARTSPAYVAAHAPAGWEALEENELRKAVKEMPTRGQDLGKYMLERILRDGKYVVGPDGLVVDHESGRALSIPLLVRMMKSLAATFGNFFLKFQNTHPQNAVLLADATAPDKHHAYRTVGKAAAVLTFLSRAEGASSIIKTGPIDLARDPIGRILAENPDQSPHLAPWKAPLDAGSLLPAMTFQVGWPLAGSDVVEPGTPNEHTGYEERRRDKRPPREDFTRHFLPAL